MDADGEQFYIRMVDSFTDGRQRVVGILDTSPRRQGKTLGGHSVIGSPVDLGSIVDEYKVHGVSISRVMLAGARGQFLPLLWAKLQAECEAREIQFGSIADQLNLSMTDDPLIDINALQIAGPANVEVDTRPIWRVKRLFDLLFALTAGLVLLPVGIVVAILVLIDSGFPAVFWQERLGRGGAPIYVYKFRTLKSPFDENGNLLGDEARISWLGRFLRATRLDEIPQIFNLLTGEMSVIGPRPLLPHDQPSGISMRLSVRPGITGWAQIHGGKLVGVEEKNALDEWYIRHASLGLDLTILFRTVLIAFKGDKLDDAAVRKAMDEAESLGPKEHMAKQM